MPQFIKMGLGGTGYLGQKESYSRSAKKREARRKVLPGFPITVPFQSIKDVREYLSGDKIICMLCGKSYKKLGNHLLAIHGMNTDDYRKLYAIPWTYGLASATTRQAYREQWKRRIDAGWTLNMKFDEDHLKMINAPKRKPPHEVEIRREIITKAKESGRWARGGKPRRPLTIGPDGELETFTQRRNRLKTKRGSPEHREKMRKLGQDRGEETGKRFGNYWRGRKQTEEHVAKRMTRFKKEE